MSDGSNEPREPVGCVGCNALRAPERDYRRFWHCFASRGDGGVSYLPHDFKGCPQHSRGHIRSCKDCDAMENRPGPALFGMIWCNRHDFGRAAPFTACQAFKEGKQSGTGS